MVPERKFFDVFLQCFGIKPSTLPKIIQILKVRTCFIAKCYGIEHKKSFDPKSKIWGLRP